MTEDLAAPGQADQIVMFDHPPMRLQLSAGLQAENEILVLQTDQLNQVAILGVGAV